MREELKEKVNGAIKLLQVSAGGKVVEVAYSGGKDSDVILELVRMSGIDFRAIYKNTTIDPPGTLRHCVENGVEVMRPKMTFLHMVERNSMPTRRTRFCCRVLKEYKVLDMAVHGIRRSESTARYKRYSEDEPVICRIYGSKKNHVNVILPILSWTDDDVAEFIEERSIKCHPLYYDDSGNFHVERRLGCLGCPMKTDAGRADYKAYPLLFKQVVKSVIVWWQAHPQAKSIQKFGTPYGMIAHNLFYRSYADWLADDKSLFGKKDWKIFLEEYFGVELWDV